LNNPIRNYAEDQESIELLVQNHSAYDFKESSSQPKLTAIPKSESSLGNNHQSRNKSDKNLQNKGYLLKSLEKEPEERDYFVDVRNLSIDEKLSTKKINKMLNNDYKFFKKPMSDNANYKYEEPENDSFQRIRKTHKELKKSALFVQEVIKEKTEENVIEATEPSLHKGNFESLNGFEKKSSNYNSLINKAFNFKLMRKYTEHKNTINSLAFDSDLKTLWSGSHDYSIKVKLKKNYRICFHLI